MMMTMKMKGRRMRVVTLGIQKMMLATRRENAVSSLSSGQVRLGWKLQWRWVLSIIRDNTLFSPASFDDRLEDDDFDLIEENLGVKVKRGVSIISLSLSL